SVDGGSVVGDCQLTQYFLIHRHRWQASSHRICVGHKICVHWRSLWEIAGSLYEHGKHRGHRSMADLLLATAS
ncbi:hypothetical protein NQF78_16290, partial [Pseudomonas monsensis]